MIFRFTTLTPRQLWINALRSGEYKQGRNKLHKVNGEDQFCCLGVACDLYQKEVGGLEERQKGGVISYQGNANDLPTVVMKWAGLSSPGGHPLSGSPGRSLIALNDNGTPFEEIAEILENDDRYFKD